MGQLYVLAAAEGSQAPLVPAPHWPLQGCCDGGGVLGSSPSLITSSSASWPVWTRRTRMPLVLVVMTHFRCIFLPCQGCSSSSSLTEWWTFLFFVYGFGRPSLEPEVQWGVCVHSSIVEPTVMLFTVPVNGYTIVATAIVVTPYSSSADGPDSAAPLCCRGVCVAMSCGGGCFLVVLTILFGTV